MVADHGGGAESERKAAWPEAVSHRADGPGEGETTGTGQVGGQETVRATGQVPRQDTRREASPDASADGHAGSPDASADRTADSPDASPEADSDAGDVVSGAAGARGGGIAALSRPYQVIAALALSVIGVLGAVHLAMVFLHVAPSNTLTKQHGEAIDDWIYPEFEQNWKLFAPNPLQQNIAVHVRADVAGADGRRTTPWMSLSGEDGEAIRGNLLPSHVDQNELRRAWDFFLNSHDSENRSTGMRGDLSERYIRRIVMLRLGEHDYGGTVERIQVRSSVRSVPAPPWSEERISTRPNYRVLPWWTVDPADLPESDGAARASHGEETDK
ncbi:DUF5819 family protein [Streptomyces sp. NBC_00234]|uniref:DUF5819 family protein n=1 Tax=Streptomyces sp. NBC_00234 TaxID=2903638 RepID=UPI002E2DCA28|nr:DUF5819 family protein [Streptomyces sp. NBC_00234]